jgi:hypothetical protein
MSVATHAEGQWSCRGQPVAQRAAADEASTHGAGWRSRPAAVERLAVPEITYYALISEDHPRERPEGLI